MKNISKIILVLAFPIVLLSSCDSLLDVKSDRHIFENEHGMNSANDTLYSMFGVLSQLQRLSDSYVFLGELRGDLMSVSEDADRFLKEINSFNISPDNPFANNIKVYYSIINNCNYIIHNIDTAYVKGGVRVMNRTYAAAKAIRAWTYMQLMLNFGEVTYYDKPILTLDDALATYPVYTSMNQLAPVLIEDLRRWKDIARPNFGTLRSFDTRSSFFPIRFLLGDLYLWTGQYELAANEYRDLMFYNRVLMTNTFRSTLEVINNTFTGNVLGTWVNLFRFGSPEQLTNIVATNQYERIYTVDSLAEIRHIIPSEVAVNNWRSQYYIHALGVDTLADMRLYGSISSTLRLNANMEIEDLGIFSIDKFRRLNDDSDLTKLIMVYRAATLYLRYAEAVNRLGKPNLAMAVLKNGLRAATINNDMIVPRAERDSILPNYMNFSDERFNNNIGVRARGCGNVHIDNTNFAIPANMLDRDSIMIFVENLIINEMALETAFEGNRFHDLMRVAIRRNDNAFLADKVAQKHPASNRESIRSKLMDRQNWFLK